jgi:hypothetical protein
MDDPDEPRVTVKPTRQEPAATYDGQAAHVRLLSWGTERSPAYSLNVVRLVDGRMTCGRTFTAPSFEELRIEALNHGGRVEAIMADIDRCLVLAGWQLEIDLPDSSEVTS